MKTTDKKIKEFDTVKTFREIKDKISKDIQGMTFEQLKEYLDKTRLKPKTSWNKRDEFNYPAIGKLPRQTQVAHKVFKHVFF